MFTRTEVHGIFILHKEQFHRKYDIQIFFSLILVQFYVLISFNVNGDNKLCVKGSLIRFFCLAHQNPGSAHSTILFSGTALPPVCSPTSNLIRMPPIYLFFVAEREDFFGVHITCYFNSIIIILNASTRVHLISNIERTFLNVFFSAR